MKLHRTWPSCRLSSALQSFPFGSLICDYIQLSVVWVRHPLSAPDSAQVTGNSMFNDGLAEYDEFCAILYNNLISAEGKGKSCVETHP